MRRDLPVPGSLESKTKPEACEAPPLLNCVTGLGRNPPLSIPAPSTRRTERECCERRRVEDTDTERS